MPRAGRASSGYLFEAAGRAVVADLGHGTVGNLVRHRAPEDVDDVVISHLHADHFLDVVPLRYFLKYGPRSNERKVNLWLPPGGMSRLELLASVFDDGPEFWQDVFEVREYRPAAELELGGIRVSFAATTHYIDCFAMRFEAGSASLTYSADTAPDDAVAALARDASAFLCEATLKTEEEANVPRGHLSAREAGALAARAGTRKLLLTHYPEWLSSETLIREAAREFAGDIRVVDDNDRLDL